MNKALKEKLEKVLDEDLMAELEEEILLLCTDAFEDGREEGYNEADPLE